MTRFAWLGALALVPAIAQGQDVLVPRRVSVPIIDRGTYHVATGSWSRASTRASFASDVLYNNSSPSGYYFGATPGWPLVDSGRIPSGSSRPIVGSGSQYTVDCFSIAYCSDDPVSVEQVTAFFDLYAPCSDIDDGDVPVASFLATGLPAGTPTGGQGCWTVSFDLSGTTLEFTLKGDADLDWDDDPNIDSFGWLGSYPSATPTNDTGPVIAGNCAGGGAMSSPTQGFGTDFAGIPGATDATGLGQADFFWLDDNDGTLTPNANGGCFFFGGCNNQVGAAANPWGGFWLQIFGTPDDGCLTICSAYCSSRVNESGGAAILSLDGTDPNIDLVFTSTPVPNTTGQFFYGPMMLAGGTNLGDGLRCVGGMTTRLLPLVSAGMMMQAPNTASLAVNYTAPYAAGFTGTRYFQHWFRSGTSAGTGSNTSDAQSVTF